MAEENTETPNTETPAAETPAAGETPAVEAVMGVEDSPEAGKPVEGDTPAAEPAAGATEESGIDTNVNAVPESYKDLVIPEGVNVDDNFVESMTPFFKEWGMTEEGAQKYIDHQADTAKANQKGHAAAFTQLKADWIAEAKADKEIGGENYTQSIQHADAAVGQFGSDGLKKLFKDQGLGNHPEVIRTFAKIGKLMKEDNPGGGGSQIESGVKLDTSDLLYPED